MVSQPLCASQSRDCSLCSEAWHDTKGQWCIVLLEILIWGSGARA